jgi:hypothetical protein
LEANQAVSYFISIPRLEYREDFTDFSIDNSKTKEKFVIKHPKRNSLMISRYPIEMAANEEWIQEMEKYVDCHVVVKRCILIDLGNYYCSNN